MFQDSYRNAGVDVTAGYKTVELIQKYVRETRTDGVFDTQANFAGVYDIGNGQMLVSGTDGVGTKLKLAYALNRHDTIGIDCVAMCVNDIACHGAKPLFFLDYIASGRVYPDKIASIVSGIAEGCLQAKCALIGGETAEMPGIYKMDEYDIAGFAVGIVDKDKLIDGSTICEGDKLIGLASNGVHSNGFSLIRKLFSIDAVALSHHIDTLGTNLGEELMRPTRIYSETILSLARRFTLKGVAHITGGGFYENIPRILPEGLSANIYLGSWNILPVFEIIRAANKTMIEELFSVFNMGIGMVIAVSADRAEAVVRCAQEINEDAYIIGEVVRGDGGITLCERA